MRIYNWLKKAVKIEIPGLCKEEAVQDYIRKTPSKEEALQQYEEQVRLYNLYKDQKFVYSKHAGRIERVDSVSIEDGRAFMVTDWDFGNVTSWEVLTPEEIARIET
jgi:hypothetical protein